MKNISKVLMLTFLGSILFITSCSDPTNDYDAFLDIVKGNTYSGTEVAEETNNTSELSPISEEEETYTFTFSETGTTVTKDSSENGTIISGTSTTGVYKMTSKYVSFLWENNKLYAAYSDKNDIDWSDDDSLDAVITLTKN